VPQVYHQTSHKGLGLQTSLIPSQMAPEFLRALNRELYGNTPQSWLFARLVQTITKLQAENAVLRAELDTVESSIANPDDISSGIEDSPEHNEIAMQTAMPRILCFHVWHYKDGTVESFWDPPIMSAGDPVSKPLRGSLINNPSKYLEENRGIVFVVHRHYDAQKYSEILEKVPQKHLRLDEELKLCLRIHPPPPTVDREESEIVSDDLQYALERL
jgi:hypothetical protein